MSSSAEHDSKGRAVQALKFLQDFRKHLANQSQSGNVSATAREDLEAYADLLRTELSR